MGFSLEDPRTGQAVLTGTNRLNVSSRTNPRIFYSSRDFEVAYAWTASYNYAGGDTILLVSNSSTTQLLYIHHIYISSDTATEYVVHSPEYPTLAGTPVTGVNLNRTSGKEADAEAYQDETGNTQANPIYKGIVSADGNIEIDVDDTIILGFHDTIAVDLTTVGSLGIVTILGHFEAPDQ